MATAAEIIAKAQARIPQGDIDDNWSAQEWIDYLNDSIDMIHEAIVDADLPFYIVPNHTISKSGDNLYPLPDDCYAVLWVQDIGGEAIEHVDRESRREDGIPGFVFTNGNIELVNWGVDLPTSITIDYRKHPAIISQPTETPEAPLHTERAARILAKLMCAMALAKDEALTMEQKQLADAAISTFVDRLGSMDQTSDHIIGG